MTIIDSLNLKVFADDTFEFDENGRKILCLVRLLKKMMETGGNAGNQSYLKMFSILSIKRPIILVINDYILLSTKTSPKFFCLAKRLHFTTQSNFNKYEGKKAFNP